MGVQFLPRLEREIPGVPEVEGKSLALASMFLDLDGLAERLSLRPLADFAHMPHAGMGNPPWFPASEGLETVNGLLEYLRREPVDAPEDDLPIEEMVPGVDLEELQDGLIGDLEGMARVLEEAERRGIRFYIHMSA